MRALAVHEDAVVAVSALYQTTCTLLRAGGEAFVIDSPVLPDELEALPALAEQAGFPVSGLLATHGDWDHLLGRLAFPHASLGVGEPTLARLNSEPGAAQRALRELDDELHIDRGEPLRLGGLQGLPVPGRLTLGDAAEIELHPAAGHTADGTAFWMPWLGVLVCGDYLSPVEIPMISPGGSPSAYRATLAVLAPLVAAATTVVPGHGTPMAREQAQRLLEEDAAYLESLTRGGDARLPADRRSKAQRRVHRENLARLTDAG